MAEITVVGGGLAGLVAAITCAEAGLPVQLFEAHERLGGRGRTLDGEYAANDGTRVFYADGPHWAWLKQRNLHGPAVAVGPKQLAGFRFRSGGRLTRMPPRQLARVAAARRVTAPVDHDFHGWASERFGEPAARQVAGFLGVVTYDAAPGRLSAAFVWERFLRTTAPRWPAVRYVIGGWQAVMDRLGAHARQLGVQIDTSTRVGEIPPAPVVVATQLASARALLGDASLHWESGSSVLLDVGMRASRRDPFVVSDLDEGGFVERYSMPDPSLAPTGHSLLQAQMPVRTGESKAAAVRRLEAVLDLGFVNWRERATWRRDALAHGRTGALDLPGLTWRDRPAIDRGGGVFVAGDQMAAPGLLSEVSFSSALAAAQGAVQRARVGDDRVGRR
ncbi:MAG: FAD-dependent oxidoreductase [Nocardioidaceae bacterium]